MKVKITYPSVGKRKIHRRKFLNVLRWPLLLAVIGCPIVNLIVGGKPWSLIVLMSLYMLWTLVLSPDLVEYNRISQFIKLLVDAVILLVLIDVFLSPGWAITVVPIVSFGGLIVSGVLFFTDLRRQRQNMLPLLLLIFFSILGSGIALSVWHERNRWSLYVLGGIAVALLLVCILLLGRDFLRELHRRFHIK
jgi:O-antigen ligase